MKFNYQSEIRFSKLPFNISEKDIIYVESEYNEDVNRFIQMYYKEICNDFKRNGYNFIYFPRLSEDLLEEIINTIYPEYEKLAVNTISLKSSFMLNFLTDEDKQNYYGPSLVYSKFPPHNIYGDDEEEGAEFWFDYITMRNLDSCYMTNDLSPILDEIDDDIKHWDERERQAMEQDDSIDWFDFFDNEELFDVEKSIEDSEIEINYCCPIKLNSSSVHV